MESNELTAVVDEIMRRLESRLTPEATAGPEYLTLAEVAQRTSFSYDFVYDAARKGDLPATQKGREWRVAVTDMRAWMSRDRIENRRPTRPHLKNEINRLMPGLNR
ncbi:Helix-turn-helix domain protein [Gemmata sp. SH-PL17]|uniref:helix-turn-helix domain-containing protein n=1 Tax=Gemmata sp. SH-PL17 TaxID=1630693 RepID=UPI00078CBAA2|nr:helix-turn-helix domain-containing protein [Gemmata sp. SH-PL17]AMV29379.1 Helix-turn-helix domain protein [Gemmata sp. SH-PL17]